MQEQVGADVMSADRKPKEQTGKEVRNVPAHVLLDTNYNCVAFPAEFASQILPHIKLINKQWKSDGHEYKLITKSLEFTLLSADQMTAITVASLLTGETE